MAFECFESIYKIEITLSEYTSNVLKNCRLYINTPESIPMLNYYYYYYYLFLFIVTMYCYSLLSKLLFDCY